MFVGDDTGLLKKVKMLYNYQTDVFGTLKGSTKKDCKFGPMDGEGEVPEDESQSQKK